MMSYTVYTDGSFHIKSGKGGWGTVICHDTITGLQVEWQDYGGKKGATSSGEMEVIGVWNALKDLPDKCNVILYCDNQYALKSIVKDGNGSLEMMLGRVHYTGWLKGWIIKGWRTTTGPVKNQELWEDVMKECHRLLSNGSAVKFQWVKGHDGNEGNELADKLAEIGTSLQ